ncbi:hypothetical protein T440DRAFT_484321 [Plenodomus tracheiphilus IPT5]|uniref:Uncharacterized protein n=1 Tax=Plenodomus tracheiphilus IPT5 TaxID=1408161 RepID=A0A6A7AM69_9PLEO|nr:hypothetical protein T440DRAFT_484321 [Plenodomus tracheiphilus IPT5]
MAPSPNHCDYRMMRICGVIVGSISASSSQLAHHALFPAPTCLYQLSLGCADAMDRDDAAHERQLACRRAPSSQGLRRSLVGPGSALASARFLPRPTHHRRPSGTRLRDSCVRQLRQLEPWSGREQYFAAAFLLSRSCSIHFNELGSKLTHLCESHITPAEESPVVFGFVTRGTLGTCPFTDMFALDPSQAAGLLSVTITQCDGVRPGCGSCQTKNLHCVYGLTEDQRSTTQLRAHIRRLDEEVNGLRSIAPLLARASDQTAAALWADEVKKNGFARHSADEVRTALGGSIPVHIDTEGELYCTLDDINPIPNMVDVMPGVPFSKTGRIIPQLSTSAELSYMTGNTTEGITPANTFLPGLWNDMSVDSYRWDEVLEGL